MKPIFLISTIVLLIPSAIVHSHVLPNENNEVTNQNVNGNLR